MKTKRPDVFKTHPTDIDKTSALFFLKLCPAQTSIITCVCPYSCHGTGTFLRMNWTFGSEIYSSAAYAKFVKING